MPVMKTKTARQSNQMIRKPPNSGATMGATAMAVAM